VHSGPRPVAFSPSALLFPSRPVISETNRDLLVIDGPSISNGMGANSGVAMYRCWIACALILSGHCLGASAQDGRKSPPPNPVAISTPSGQKSAIGQELGKQQLDLIRQVNAYFNQLTILKGSFVQTSADNKRQRGKFHIMRPGRFRFEFSPPSKVVILADGQHVAIQDHDLNTDDRWDLSYTPFRALLQKDVNLLRDARIFEVEEANDTIAIAFEDRSAEASSRIKLFLSTRPTLQLRAWITKDVQGFDTRVDLTEVAKVDVIDLQLFNPAAPIERR
jgi:outer membrane lipoprotein-sorting protein